MWLEWEGSHALVVNVPKYIESQPVEYCQIQEVIEQVRSRALPVHTYIDLSNLEFSKVSLIGVIEIIWDLHERTKGDRYLQSIIFTGATRRVMCAWRTLARVLPQFVADLVKFE